MLYWFADLWSRGRYNYTTNIDLALMEPRPVLFYKLGCHQRKEPRAVQQRWDIDNVSLYIANLQSRRPFNRGTNNRGLALLGGKW